MKNFINTYYKIRSFFYKPFENQPEGISKKGVYLQAFNFSFLFLYLFAIVTRIFSYGNIFLYIGDTCAVLTLIIGIILVRKNKYHAASYSFFVIFIVIFFHNILGDIYFNSDITPLRLYETLTAMTIGIMCISLFSGKYRQIFIAYILSIATLIAHFIVIMQHLHHDQFINYQYNLIIIAIILITVIFIISALGMRLTKYLLTVNSEKYSSIFNNLTDAFIIIYPKKNSDGKSNLIIKEANPAFYTMFRLKHDTVLRGNYFTDIIKNIELENFPWNSYFSDSNSVKGDQKFILFSKKLSGWLHFYSFITDNNEIVLIISDETQRITAEKSLNASLEEKEHLVKELHHRVKNNFQVISSLINIQDFSQSENNFENVRKRISTMAGIYEMLYGSQDLSNIKVKPYVEKLVIHILDINNDKRNKVNIIQNVDSFTCPIYSAIPCALILYEFIDNSIRHCPENSEINIHIIASKTSKRVKVKLYDNGKTFSAKSSISNPTTSGFIIINSSLRQLKAEYKEFLKEGFHLHFSFYTD